ncbi:MAG: RdgB/HAM1 family non-canonical purine NTP pyrophosphatase [Candidatus Micrarchaeota archaeon]
MPNSSEILLLTSNPYKLAEAQTILKRYNLNVVSSPQKGTEIQSDSLSEVARICAENAYKKIKKPLFVEDSGLFVDGLGGFPGVYSSFALKKIGCKGILCLLDQERQRSARFECAVAYVDETGTHEFLGAVKGKISTQIFGGKGFGYDPIFIPEGHTQAFSQIFDVKQKISHRVRALEQFGKFLSEKNKK